MSGPDSEHETSVPQVSVVEIHSRVTVGEPLTNAPRQAPPPPLPAGPPRASIAPKVAPPVPSKIAGKAPPPVPQMKLSVGGGHSHALGVPSGASHVSEKSELINIHWKPASAHHPGTRSRKSPPSDTDQFLKPFVVSSSTSLERLVRDNPVPDVLLENLDDNSVFTASEAKDKELPPVKKEVIKQYFSKKQNTKFDSATMSQSVLNREEGSGKKTGLERERVKLLALALGGTISSRVNRRGIFRQYREAIVRCDYQVVTTDIMCPLLQLLKGVAEEELATSLTYVRTEIASSSFPEAHVLEEFEEPDVFLYEMSKIPEVKVRLECMIFERTFDDLFQLTMNSLNIIYSGLEVIARNLKKISTLFQLILKTGNLLNEGSKLGSHQSSFCLATLAKLTEVKSSVDPKLDVLHFILSHIPPEDAVLFTDEEIVKLKNATNLRCYRVRDEVKDLLDSIVAVTEIVKHPVPTAGDEDRFTLRMNQFSQRIKGTDQWLSKYAFNVLASYKHISSFFEDTKAVYPPPKEKSPDQFDLLELFAWFGGVVKAHEKDIKKKGLRGRIGLLKEDQNGSTVSNETRKLVEELSVPLKTVVEPLVKPGTADPSYVLEPASLGGSKTILPSEKQSSTLPPSFTREQLQSSLSSLGSPTAPPLVAIINRGGTRGDLTASKPKLSPIISPVIDVLVTPAVSPPTTPKAPTAATADNALKPPPFAPAEGSGRTLSVKELSVGGPLRTSGALPVPKRHILITPQGAANRSSRPDVTVSVLASGSVSRSPEEDNKKEEESVSFFSSNNRAYPSRNEDFYPNYAVLNSRQSLSNTISRVAMLLSPSKEDGGIYKGTRRRVPSLSSNSPGSGS